MYTTSVDGAQVSTSTKSTAEGVAVQTSQCEGVGAMECEQQSNVVNTFANQEGTESDTVSMSTDVTTTVQSLTLTASTSQSPTVYDGDGDLFLLATTDMTYSTATVLEAKIVDSSTQTCSVTPPYPNIVYTQSPLNYLTW